MNDERVSAAGVEPASPGRERWPALPLASWQDSRDTLHLWTQIVGKTKLALAPPLNHWWGVTLGVTASGLSTSLMPYGPGALDVAFDFVDHHLTLRTTAGEQRRMSLEPRSVHHFYAEYRSHLSSLGVDVAIHSTPVELVDVIPFDRDTTHASYDPSAVHDFWVSLVAASEVCARFRGEFRGKASPVHFFWGAFDLAVTRFSGWPRRGSLLLLRLPRARWLSRRTAELARRRLRPRPRRVRAALLDRAPGRRPRRAAALLLPRDLRCGRHRGAVA